MNKPTSRIAGAYRLSLEVDQVGLCIMSLVWNSENFYNAAPALHSNLFFVVRVEVTEGGGIISAMFTGNKVTDKTPVDS